EPSYQVSVGASQPFRAFVQDLASAGARADVSGSAIATYKATRPQLNLTLVPQDVSFTAAGVVNGATFASGIAPGGIMPIFGRGFSGAGSPTAVEIDGVPAPVLAATPFQINAQVPPSILAGNHTLRVRSAYGAAEQSIAVSEVAPGIFLIGNPP